MTLEEIVSVKVPFHFGVCDDDDWDLLEEGNKYREYFENKGFECRNGVSKFVILPKDGNYVVKIPFGGNFYWNEKIEDYEFCEFDTKDYCAVEAMIYEKAEEAGIEYFFAGTRYGGKTGDGITPYYISEKAYDGGEVENKTPTLASAQIATSLLVQNRSCDLDRHWVTMAVECYGEEKVELLFTFIKDNHISDLHCGNLGFNIEGKPVILDYSSFRN